MTKQCRLCATDHLAHAIVLLEEAGATGTRPPIAPQEIQELIGELHQRGPQPLTETPAHTHL